MPGDESGGSVTSQRVYIAVFVCPLVEQNPTDGCAERPFLQSSHGLARKDPAWLGGNAAAKDLWGPKGPLVPDATLTLKDPPSGGAGSATAWSRPSRLAHHDPASDELHKSSNKSTSACPASCTRLNGHTVPTWVGTGLSCQVAP